MSTSEDQMLRLKRRTPVRSAPADPSSANPLHGLKTSFVQWTVAIGLSPQTAGIRRSALDHFIRWCHCRAIDSPSQISRDLLEAYQLHLVEYRKASGEPLELSTQATRLNPIKAFCKWMVRNRLVELDASRELILPRLPKRLPRRIPSVIEVRAIIGSAGTGSPLAIRDRAMMETLYSTGLRRMELANLRIVDVGLDASTVLVRCGKGRRDRLVPLGSVARSWIEQYLRDVRPLLAAGVDRGELFLTDYGEPFRRNRLGDRLRSYVARCGLPGACHIFRHACATHMLENGADIRFIQAMLGHSQLSTTEIYTQVSISKLKAVHAQTHPGCASHHRKDLARPSNLVAGPCTRTLL
jgi:integrase/recombinase XerD